MSPLLEELTNELRFGDPQLTDFQRLVRCIDKHCIEHKHEGSKVIITDERIDMRAVSYLFNPSGSLKGIYMGG